MDVHNLGSPGATLAGCRQPLWWEWLQVLGPSQTEWCKKAVRMAVTHRQMVQVKRSWVWIPVLATFFTHEISVKGNFHCLALEICIYISVSFLIVKFSSPVYVPDESRIQKNITLIIICLKIFCQKEKCLSEKMSQRHVSLVSIPIGFPLQRQSEILFSTWLEEETLFPGITSQSETPTPRPPPRLGIKRRKKTIRNWNKWLEKLMDRKRKESCPLFFIFGIILFILKS